MRHAIKATEKALQWKETINLNQFPINLLQFLGDVSSFNSAKIVNDNNRSMVSSRDIQAASYIATHASFSVPLHDISISF